MLQVVWFGQYGITPADSAKSDVTMRFLVEKYPNKVIPRKKNVAVTCVGYIGKVSLFTLVSIYSKGW